jgi:hypothetical protein
LQGAEFGYFGVAGFGESAEFGADVWPCFKIASSRSVIAPGAGGGVIRTGGGDSGRHRWDCPAQPDRSSRNRAASKIIQLGPVRVRSSLRTRTRSLFFCQLLLEFLDLGTNFVTALFL